MRNTILCNRNFCALVLFLSLNLGLSSQTTFIKGYYNHYLGADARSLKQTPDGGYILAGTVNDSISGSTNIHLIKANSSGDTSWMKTYFYTGQSLSASYVLATTGGYTVCGTLSGTNDALLLLRANNNGTIVWSKTFDGPGNEIGNCVQRTVDGGYVLCGSTTSFGSGLKDIYVVKTDSSGIIQWTKTFGGGGADEALYISQCTDSGYVLCGSTGSYGPGNGDCILVRLSASGNLQWSKVWGGNYSDLSNCVKQTSDLGFIVCGTTYSYGITNGVGTLDNIYLNKFSSSGVMQWGKAYADSAGQRGFAVLELAGGRYAMTGRIYNPQFYGYSPFLIRTASNGNILTQNIIYWLSSTQRLAGFDLIKTNDNGFAIPGSYSDFLFKTDSLGKTGCSDLTYNIIAFTSPTTTVTPSPGISSGGNVSNITVQTTSGGDPFTYCALNGENSLPETQMDVLLYPNPSDGKFTIEVIGDNFSGKEIDVSIYNAIGQTVFSSALNKASKLVTLNNQAPGLYFVSLRLEDGVSVTKKIVIE